MPEAKDLSTPGAEHDYYAHDDAWTAFPTARAEVNRRITGRDDERWIDAFARCTDGRTFRRALVLNCGAGMVERRLVQEGMVASAVGIDISQDLLDGAAAEAHAAGLPIDYRRLDVNRLDELDDDVDLVVNHAAAHHVRYLDRVLRRCRELLVPDGWMVSWDYVGAARNQWPWDQWEAAVRLDQELPEDLRNGLVYPHLPTMIDQDPTEAVHSDLFFDHLDRYFEVVERRDAGGCLAYLVLTHNQALLDAEATRRDEWVDHVMAADAAWHDEHPGRTTLTYVAARPRAEAPPADRCRRWTAEEDEREAAAEAGGGEYGPRTVLQQLTLALSDAQVAAEHRLAYAHQQASEHDAERARLEAELAELQRRYDHLARRPPNRQVAWLGRLLRRARIRSGGSG